jgi:AraC-like DNA-binding protein
MHRKKVQKRRLCLPRCDETPIAFRSLYGSPLIEVRDYNCRACRGGPTPEENSRSNNIVLLRHGAFCKHFGRHSVVADVNQAVFFSAESTYRVSHPADCGDRGTVFAVSPRLLNDIVRELDPSIEDHPKRPFSFVTGPCDSDVFWRHRELVQRLETAEINPLEHLWADVTAIQLVADVLEAAFARHGLPRKRRRDGTDADHTERVEAVKIHLASRLGERISLEEVARMVHTSPFHLARIFQQRTTVPIHRYLMRLRLRASLERLAAGAVDLTALALELGFSSHSHFTDSFRKEFGCTPSAIRCDRTPRAIREMSKNLEV